MKKLVLMITALMACMVVGAANVVTVEYNGATATVTIPGDLAAYVTCSSGTSSHVKIEQLLTDENNPDKIEITYELHGSSDDGGFEMKGSYKCTVKLTGLTLNNPTGPAINIDDGRRIELNAGKEGVINTLTDGTDGNWKACIYAKGHFELKGKGTLNVTGNTAHAISCKEYMQFKNQTLNILGAVKDGIHCKQYFLMEKGIINISGVADDGIQVELVDDEAYTGILPGHKFEDEDADIEYDENTGNCYQDDGTLTIGTCGGYVIHVDGEIVTNGGTSDYDATSVKEKHKTSTGIMTLPNDINSCEVIYDLTGRQLKDIRKGQIVIIKKDNEVRKVIIQ